MIEQILAKLKELYNDKRFISGFICGEVFLAILYGILNQLVK